MRIEKDDNQIIVKFKATKERRNPWQETHESMPRFVGLVTDDEWGLANRIDMDYAGKPDQVGPIIVKCTDLDKEEFIKQCQDNHIAIINRQSE